MSIVGFVCWPRTLGPIAKTNSHCKSCLYNKNLYIHKQKTHKQTNKNLGEIALLLFGLRLVYKLRNASSEVHKEKLILCLAVALELTSSLLVYLVRHLLWSRLAQQEGDLWILLPLYAARCQLTVTLTVLLVFIPKVSKGREMRADRPKLAG